MCVPLSPRSVVTTASASAPASFSAFTTKFAPDSAA